MRIVAPSRMSLMDKREYRRSHMGMRTPSHDVSSWEEAQSSTAMYPRPSLSWILSSISLFSAGLVAHHVGLTLFDRSMTSRIKMPTRGLLRNPWVRTSAYDQSGQPFDGGGLHQRVVMLTLRREGSWSQMLSAQQFANQRLVGNAPRFHFSNYALAS